MASNLILKVMIIIYIWTTTVTAETTSLSYTITCNSSFQADCQNLTLDTIVSNITGHSDVYIDIKTPQLQLKEMINFTGLNSLTITGRLDIQTSIVCSAGNTSAGIVLRDISGSVELYKLNLTSCGTKVVTDFDSKIFISALTIIHCRNVELNDITIERSRGIGLMIVNHLGGEVIIESAIFRENRLWSDYCVNSSTSEYQVHGGGGVYVMFKDFLPQRHHFPIVFQFQSCTFENNTANTSLHNHLYTNVLGKARKGYGRGGGVYVLLSSGLRNVSVSFSNCTFTANRAFLGSGLAVRIYGEKLESTEDIQVKIKDSIFKRNGCGDNKSVKPGLGGGAHLTFDSYLSKSHIINSHYIIENVQFIENCAELGGGVNHISGKQSFGDNLSSNSITFENCSFEGNKAHIGSAIFLASSIDRRLSTGYSITVKFSDCLFTHNLANVTNNSLSVNQIIPGAGTIYVSSYNVHFDGYTNFTKNTGSALHVVNGLVNFQNSSATFANNRAVQGGALALIGSSIIIVGPNQHYEFIENSAIYKGGAIYVSLINSVDFISSELCFIQCVDDNNSIISWDWNNNITFTRNYAKDETSGHTIYATSLHPCQAIYNVTADGQNLGHTYTLVNTTKVFNIRGIKFDEGSQIATDGAILHSNRPTPLAIIPGERYEHNVTVTDDLDQLINASFWTSFKSRDEGAPINITLASRFSTVITDRINIRGEPNQKAILYMNIVSARQSFIQLDVEVLNCPPGFKLKDYSECVCDTIAHVGMFKCDLDSFQSHLISGYWAGYINDSHDIPKFVTSACPFCNYSHGESSMMASDFEVILPRNRSKLDETVCGGTRTGIVCGRCRDGYTVHFHSPGFMCKPAEPVGCKLGWLFYILSELVPVTAVFITVLVLNISFTSGAINSFILFSQLLGSFDLNAGGITMLPLEELKFASQGYQIFYGFFNLDYFNSESLSFCLWKGASALDMLAFKYITILYTALLIVIVIWIMNKCVGRCLGKCCRITAIKASVVHGISSFLMIGYFQCINVSLNLLIQVTIHAARDGDFRPHNRVWFNGEIVHFSKEHLPYALPAIFCLLTIGFIPPLLLVIYPLLNKIVTFLGLEKQIFITLVSRVPSAGSLKPFLDSFQGCFKDNMRFFAGIYFLYRWTILLIHMSTGEFFEHYTAVGGLLVFILTLHTVCQPYIKRAHNVIDALLLCNLALINFLSLFNFYRSSNPKIPNSTIIPSAIVQVVLIYLPALVMTPYMLFYFYKYIYSCIFKTQISTETIFVPKRAIKLKNLVRSISSQNENSESFDEDLTHDRLMDDDVEFKTIYDGVDEQDSPGPRDTYSY